MAEATDVVDGAAGPVPKARVSIGEKLQLALKLKTEGNEWYKKGEFKKAAGKYHRAVLYLKGIDSDLRGSPLGIEVEPKPTLSASLSKELSNAKVAVYNNLAASLIASETADPKNILGYLETVLDIEPVNQKAWHRKGIALMRLHKFEEAKDSLKKSADLVKNAGGQIDPLTIRLIKECDEELKSERAEQRSFYQNMFAKSAAKNQ